MNAPKPLKVLYLSAAGMLGGAERSLYELLCALPEDEIQAHACVPNDSPLARWFSLAEVPVHPIPMRRYRRTLHPFVLAGQIRALHRSARCVREIVERLQIDLIHANTDSAALVAWEVNREIQTPFVWHARDLRPLGALARVLLGRTASAIAISKAVQHHLKSQGVPDHKNRLLYNGIDLARFYGQSAMRTEMRNRTRASLGIADHKKLLLSVGAWIPWKRHELFFETLALARQRDPQVIGILAGSDLFGQHAQYAQYLQQMRTQLGLNEEQLLVLGERDDVPELMAAADVLISTSDNEPYGRVLAEAGAAGLPVVSTASGAKGEIVKDGQTGLLVAEATGTALAAATLRLLEDKALAEHMSTAAQAHIASHFDIRRAASEVRQLYREILSTTEKR